MSRRLSVLLFAALLSQPLVAQQLVSFTESQGGETKRPLGYPVPIPVASLEAVDGFRDYAGLEARLQALALASDDLSAHEVGTTQGHGRSVWAYRVGDADATDNEGGPEAAFFINAGIHAREWGTQEISTWLVERMMAGADDGAIVRWLLDSTTLVIVPVHNIDGFLQAQRYPAQALVGADPRFPASWPRDGRMRRKNMRGVDELLQTVGDHLGGIDLNRNHPPFWNTSVPNGSSPDPEDLIHHGSGRHSEAESLALVQALLLAPPERLRMGVDIHSFSQVFYSSNTGRARLNAVQAALLSRVSAHHRTVSVPDGGISGVSYTDVHDPAGVGMGTVAEYLAYEHLVPAWTLEIEPNGQRGGRQYGGTSDGHAGFILPASEVRRVREAWAESHLLAFYYMAGAPHLAEVRIVDAASGVLAAQQRWRREGSQRTRVAAVANALQPGHRYRAELVFSKPMRVPVEGAAPSGMPGQFITSTPSLMLVGSGQQIGLGAGEGSWLAEGARYAYDTFALEFDAPATPGRYALRVDTTDAVGQRLDANPATPVDWVQGSWSGLENADGTAGDAGGADATSTVLVQAGDTIVIASRPTAVGEGDVGWLRLARPNPSDRRISADTWPINPSTPDVPPPVPVTWGPGEGGDRLIPILPGDDMLAEGDRSVDVRVYFAADDEQGLEPFASFQVAVLDNDLPGRAVRRVTGDTPASLETAIADAAFSDGPVDIVLDGGRSFHIHALGGSSSGTSAYARIAGSVHLFGNGATIAPTTVADAARRPWLLDVPADAQLQLEHVTLSPHAQDGASGADGGVLNIGTTIVRRSRVDAFSGNGIRSDGGTLVLDRTVVQGAAGATPLHVSAGSALVTASALLADSRAASTGVQVSGGGLDIDSAAVLAGHPLAGAPPLRGSVAGSQLTAHGTSAGCSGAVLASAGANVIETPAGTDGLRCVQHVAADLVRGGASLFAGRSDLAGPIAPGGPAVDASVACMPLDLQGRPRPQAQQPGDTPLCDAGAIELGTNPYRGLWIPDRSGHGVDIHTAGNTLFLTWYTYHPDGTPAAYQAAAPLTGPVWRAALSSARRLPDGSIERFEAGEIGLDFTSDTEATLRWRIGTAGQWGEEGLRAYLFAAGEPRFETTGTWYDPDDSGWGLTVTRRGEVTGLVLYYYDAEGTLRWALAQGGDGDVLSLPLSGYTGFCPDCDAEANPPTASPAGTLQVQFLTPVRARVWVDAGADGQRFQREAAPLLPLNDPVDNRHAAAAAAQSAASSDGSR